MPAVSIILPTRDRGPQLTRAAKSVSNQTLEDWELIVVDNNTREPSLSTQRPNLPWLDDPRVRLLRPERIENAATARNAGLNAARGRWITYLDDDDAYRPSKLARQVELAENTRAPVVLCGAVYRLQGRNRAVQCHESAWHGDQLILRARWNTPLLFHPHPGHVRFDESLSPGEDAEFGHRLVALADASTVPVVPEPLVDIYPQPGPRVNSWVPPLRPSAARILALRSGYFSRTARRRYVLQTLLTIAKLRAQPARCMGLGWQLLRESGGADWRPCANALVVSVGYRRGRWVS